MINMNIHIVSLILSFSFSLLHTHTLTCGWCLQLVCGAWPSCALWPLSTTTGSRSLQTDVHDQTQMFRHRVRNQAVFFIFVPKLIRVSLPLSLSSLAFSLAVCCGFNLWMAGVVYQSIVIHQMSVKIARLHTNSESCGDFSMQFISVCVLGPETPHLNCSEPLLAK